MMNRFISASLNGKVSLPLTPVLHFKVWWSSYEAPRGPVSLHDLIINDVFIFSSDTRALCYELLLGHAAAR